MIELNEKGILPAGIHEYTLKDFIMQFSKKFPESITRAEILKDFKTLLNETAKICLPEYVWIDGSFVTSKQNPNDIDFCYFIDYKSATQNIVYQINNVFNSNRKILKCDPYIVFHFDGNPKTREELSVVNNRNYWRGQFGFDRLDNPKGIVKLNKTQINSMLNGGISYDE